MSRKMEDITSIHPQKRTSSLCPILKDIISIRGSGNIAIQGRIRTTVYVDSNLFVRGRSDNLNFSEILNLALAAIYETEYGKDKQIIRNRIPLMQESISERVKMEKNEIGALQRQVEAVEQAEERVHQTIIAALNQPLGEGRLLDMAKRRRHDPYGDYIDWWEDLAADISQAAGREVSVSQIQAVVRRGH